MNRQHSTPSIQSVTANRWQSGTVSANDESLKKTVTQQRQRSYKNTQPGVPTGLASLDQALPWKGLPTRGLIEIVCKPSDMAELQLLLPVLQQRSQGKQSLLWMTPPYSLQGEALQQTGINLKNSFVIPAQAQCNQALWSLEKALQSKECSMVLAWQNWLSARVLRRLELAAQHGNTLGVVFHQRPQPRSSTSLQLQIQVLNDRISGRRALEVTVLQAAGQALGSKHRLMLS